MVEETMRSVIASAALRAVRSEIRRMPEVAAQDWVKRYGQPRDRTQFIVRIALHSIRQFCLSGREAVRFASSAYRDFEHESRTKFGDPAFSWDDDAARILALEYGSDR